MKEENLEKNWKVDHKTKRVTYTGATQLSRVNVKEMYSWLQGKMEKERKRLQMEEMIKTFKML